MLSRLVLLAVVAALGGSSCFQGNCSATCVDGSFTFDLSSPLAFRDLTITVAPPTSQALTIDCLPADGSIACTPQFFTPHIDSLGRLASVEVPNSGTGTYRIQIASDGAPAIDQTNQYGGTRVEGACGSRCYPPANFVIAD